MSTGKVFGWLDVHRIGEELADAHPKLDPLAIRFTDLRTLVEALPNFKEEPGHPVNERILETIQKYWHEEREGLASDED